MSSSIVFVICELCDTKATMPIRVSFSLTVERMKEEALVAFKSHCVDVSVKYDPPSRDAADYELAPCDVNGVEDTSSRALVPSRRGGETVRVQVMNQNSSGGRVHLLLRIGSMWLQRYEGIVEERAQRATIDEKRDVFLGTLEYFADVSFEKALDQQMFREHHVDHLVHKFEEVMLYAFVAFKRYQDQVRGEQVELNRLCAKFRDVVVPHMEATGEQLQREKKMFLHRCVASVTIKRIADDISEKM